MPTRRTYLLLSVLQGGIMVVTGARALGPSASLTDWLTPVGGATLLLAAFVVLARPGNNAGEDANWWLVAVLVFTILTSVATNLL